MTLKKILWISVVLLAIIVGIYPIVYYIFDMHKSGLLATKKNLISQPLWHNLFYIHITCGGIALLTGWTQFSKKIRSRHIQVHRRIGQLYVTSVFLSAGSGLYIACFATGGIISELGFGTLACLWMITNFIAYLRISQKQVGAHEQWMIRSYALTFAAVSLRVFLPLTTSVLNIDSGMAYHIVAWMCWIPNLIIAESLIRRKKLSGGFSSQLR